MSNKAEWLFLLVLFVFAVATTVLYPPSGSIEGSGSVGIVEAAELAEPTSD